MRVKIERLQIRARGVAPETVHRAAGNLGHEVIERLATESLARARGTTRLAEVEAGIARVSASADGAEIGQVIAERIARAIGEKLSR